MGYWLAQNYSYLKIFNAYKTLQPLFLFFEITKFQKIFRNFERIMKITFKKNSFFRIICIVQLFVASGICIYFSSQENIELPDINSFDKFAHLVAYFIYGLSLQVAFIAFFINSSQIKTNKNIAILVTVVGFLFALSDEIHQYFVPGRVADIFDLLVNFVGISLSLLFINTVRKIMNKIMA